MPITSLVGTLSLDDTRSVGDYLRAVKAGRCEPADLVAVPVGTDGSFIVDAALDSVLGVRAADVIGSAQLTGKAGQIVSAVAILGEKLVRGVVLGVAGRPPSAPRKAGGEPAPPLPPGGGAVGGSP